MGDLIDEMTRRSYYHFSRSCAWQPQVNVYHDQDHYYLCVELAGLAKDKIHVDVAGNKITIRGDRPAPPPPMSEGQVSLLRMEIDSGPFERCIELPERADMEQVTAKLADGFLWITIAKRAAR